MPHMEDALVLVGGCDTGNRFVRSAQVVGVVSVGRLSVTGAHIADGVRDPGVWAQREAGMSKGETAAIRLRLMSGLDLWWRERAAALPAGLDQVEIGWDSGAISILTESQP